MQMIQDKRCARCGYELTGLDYEGRCPECGGFYDRLTGEGLAGGRMEKHQRGEWAVRLLQSIGLILLSAGVFSLGVIFYKRTGGLLGMGLFGFIGLTFLAMAITIGFSLRKPPRPYND